MKTSLHKHSFRTVGLALAIGLGLAAASHSAQAAIVQITLGGNNWTFTPNSPLLNTNLDVTGDTTLDSVTLLYSSFSDQGYDPNVGRIVRSTDNFLRLQSQNGDIAGANIKLSDDPLTANDIPMVTQQNSYGRSERFTFTDSRINGGVETTGWAQGFGSIGNDNSLSVTLTRVVFDNLSTNAPTFTGSETGITEWSASSTAVPEPGTFIPAAVLVMGAILRRRRSRSHRGGRATA